jgi:hypothetical protein
VFGPPKEPTPIEPRLTGQRPLVMREPRAVVMTEDGDRVDDSDSSDDRHRSDRD